MRRTLLHGPAGGSGEGVRATDPRRGARRGRRCAGPFGLDECRSAAKLAGMTFIETVPADAATGEVAAMYDADRELRGFLPNYTQAFSPRAGVYAAWRQLVSAITQNIDPRRYELVSVAAARALRSTYCTAAHSGV